ncbi:hypothetical protein K503DRAFT_191331 [Rhizopogon vinicolor AM-OR11-026]|uniref:Uncharacterized protein n=1 Tax=Rhizopogon vinicolor AM-OR11-026 TaxID=1314800 RepID=A0A1B7MDI5_9AGAM|nr:hypothetical protein K503DRAFT_191331 [Rhizopogon vinicolor AM-OR11-026]
MDPYDVDSPNDDPYNESQSLLVEDGTSPRTPNNPEGRNQRKRCLIAPKNDQSIQQILAQYHRDGITDREKISRLLKAEHGVTMSEATVARRRQQFGLLGSAQSTYSLPGSTKRQLVLDQLDTLTLWNQYEASNV